MYIPRILEFRAGKENSHVTIIRKAPLRRSNFCYILNWQKGAEVTEKGKTLSKKAKRCIRMSMHIRTSQ